MNHDPDDDLRPAPPGRPSHTRWIAITIAVLVIIAIGSVAAALLTSSEGDNPKTQNTTSSAPESAPTSAPTSEGTQASAPEAALTIDAAVMDLPGYTSTAVLGDSATLSRVLGIQGELKGLQVLAMKRYTPPGATDSQVAAYVLGVPGTRLQRPVQGSCAPSSGSPVIQLSGQDVCEQLQDPLWILTWGSNFTLRVFSGDRSLAEGLMGALIVANGS
jgi:hypothetical protein